jgi:hypothetical protein
MFRRCSCSRRRAPPSLDVAVRAPPPFLAPGSRSSAPASPRARSSTGRLPSSPNGAARQRAPAFFFLSEPAAEQRWWKNPNGGGWSCLLPELLPSSFESTPRGFEEERSTVPSARRRLGPGGGRGDARPASDAWGKGAAGSFPFSRGRPWVRVHTPVLACVPAGRLGRARHPARAGAAGPAARPPGSAVWLGWSKR